MLKTYPDVKALETVARSSAQRHHLRTGIRDADLKVAVGVLLLKNHANGLFYVDQEAPRGGGLLVV